MTELPVSERTQVTRHPERQARERALLDQLLDEALIAHVGIVRDGFPVVLPFACARDGDSLLLHGSTGGMLLRAAAIGPVAATITHLDGLVVARTTFESSMNYRSAVVHGVPEVLEGEEKVAALNTLSDHLIPGRMSEVATHTRKELAATLVLRLPLTEVSVKVSTGPPSIEDDLTRDAWAGVLPLYLEAGTPVPYDGSGEPPPSVIAVITRLRAIADRAVAEAESI
ncbi:MAG: pyridoxamine 5'-phosphate oxidase family protein [Nocardioidaceae bacterium]